MHKRLVAGIMMVETVLHQRRQNAPGNNIDSSAPVAQS
jgi:hypothetical protein